MLSKYIKLSSGLSLALLSGQALGSAKNVGDDITFESEGIVWCMKNLIKITLVTSSLIALGACNQNGGYYKQRNLVTNDVSKYGMIENGKSITVEDENMINPWGVDIRPAGLGGHFWISNTDTGTVSTYVGDTDSDPLYQDSLKLIATEMVSKDGDPATPTGQVFNGSKEFPCSGVSFTGKKMSTYSKFLIVTEDGNIQCWGEVGNTLDTRMQSYQIVKSGNSNSVYKGVAIANLGDKNYMYVADFGNKSIDTYDGNYNKLKINFNNPQDIDSSFAPFNVRYLEYIKDGKTEQSVFVAYAKLTDVIGEEEKGQGLGYVAEFDVKGNYKRTLEYNNNLSAPWGITLAPKDFGKYSNTLLIGNFGDGTIVAYDLTSGKQEGFLKRADGAVFQIEGLWDIKFGNGASLGRSNYLYFTAAPNNESDGVFGSVHWVK